MKIFLRQRKQTRTGTFSLYLEFYKGVTKTPTGKIKPRRHYEYLNLYLIDKPTNPIDKHQNKEILKLAESIKAKRLLEVKNGTYGFTNEFKQKTNYIDYFSNIVSTKKEGTAGNWHGTLKHLQNFAGDNITFKDIDKQFAEDFKEYLNKAIKKKMATHFLTTAKHLILPNLKLH